MSHQIGLVFGLASVLAAIGFLTIYGDGREGRRADIAMVYGLMAWMVYDSLADRLVGVTRDSIDDFVEFVSYQICLAAATLLVLVGAAVPSIKLWWSVGFQAVGGGGFLATWVWTGEPNWFAAWHWFNLILVVGVVSLLTWQIRVHLLTRNGARVALSTLLLMCGIVGAWPLSFAPWLAPAGIHVFPAVLVCAWWLLSDRFGRLNAMGPGFDPKASNGGHEETRQRIAQEVHDGVGAHLVAILSSLDVRDVQQKDLVLSLEQCLLDLKIMVDNLYDEVKDPVEALASLRYRLQPCLDRIGVRMVWDVEEHAVMGRLDDATAVQILKIAQEAMANVMRHAHATEVRLSFRYDEASQRVVLTIADNGCGFDLRPNAVAIRGKGLPGMLRRANNLGATMRVESAPGKGTTVHVSACCYNGQ